MFFCWHRWNLWMPIGGLKRYTNTGRAYYELQRECTKCGLIQLKMSSASLDPS
jgi:hypothetical protein